MAKLVFSFLHGDDRLKEDLTRFYVQAVDRTKELFGKAVIPDTPIAQRTWIKLQDYPLEVIESIFNAVINNGFVIARRNNDTKESVSARVKASLSGSVLDTFKTHIDFESGLFPEDISTSRVRVFDLIPRHDDPDESKMVYCNLIAKDEIDSWWSDITLLVEQMVEVMVKSLDHYIDGLMTLPADATYDLFSKASHEDYFKIYIPKRY